MESNVSLTTNKMPLFDERYANTAIVTLQTF